MKERTRKDQLNDFVRDLYKDTDLPKAARKHIRNFGRDCMMVGAAEERYRALMILNKDVPNPAELINSKTVLTVLGFEK